MTVYLLSVHGDADAEAPAPEVMSRNACRSRATRGLSLAATSPQPLAMTHTRPIHQRMTSQ